MNLFYENLITFYSLSNVFSVFLELLQKRLEKIYLIYSNQIEIFVYNFSKALWHERCEKVSTKSY